jgi:hypothetical protein
MKDGVPRSAAIFRLQPDEIFFPLILIDLQTPTSDSCSLECYTEDGCRPPSYNPLSPGPPLPEFCVTRRPPHPRSQPPLRHSFASQNSARHTQPTPHQQLTSPPEIPHRLRFCVTRRPAPTRRAPHARNSFASQNFVQHPQPTPYQQLTTPSEIPHPLQSCVTRRPAPAAAIPTRRTVLRHKIPPEAHNPHRTNNLPPHQKYPTLSNFASPARDRGSLIPDPPAPGPRPPPRPPAPDPRPTNPWKNYIRAAQNGSPLLESQMPEGHRFQYVPPDAFSATFPAFLASHSTIETNWSCYPNEST